MEARLHARDGNASTRIIKLTRSVEAALWLVPQPLRADYRRRLDASLARDAVGTGAAPARDRVTLLHEFLAARGPARVTSKEVLRHLRANRHPTDAKAVARLMSAKCQQGLLTRTGPRQLPDRAHPPRPGAAAAERRRLTPGRPRRSL